MPILPFPFLHPHIHILSLLLSKIRLLWVVLSSFGNLSSLTLFLHLELTSEHLFRKLDISNVCLGRPSSKKLSSRNIEGECSKLLWLDFLWSFYYRDLSRAFLFSLTLLRFALRFHCIQGGRNRKHFLVICLKVFCEIVSPLRAWALGRSL